MKISVNILENAVAKGANQKLDIPEYLKLNSIILRSQQALYEYDFWLKIS